MSEHVKRHQEDEMATLGKAFMGFLMGTGAIYGLWFLSGFIVAMVEMMG